MNDKELSASISASELLTKALFPEVESSVSGSEPRQRASSSQPENPDLPSFSSPEVENSTTGNGTEKTSFGYERKSVSRKPISLSIANTIERVKALYASNYTNKQRSLVRRTVEECRRRCLERVVQQPRVFEWEDSTVGRDLVYRFRYTAAQVHMNQHSSDRFVVTDSERSFLEEVVRRPLYRTLAATVDHFNFPPLLLSGLYPSGQSIEALEMAMAQVWLINFTADIKSYLAMLRMISRASESNTSSEHRDSQSSSSAFKNEVHDSKIKLIEPGQDSCERESCALKDTLKDDPPHESPREAQSAKLEIKSEINAGDPNLDEDLMVTEALDRDSSNLLRERSGVPPEKSSEESPQGTPAIRSEIISNKLKMD